MRSTIRVLVGVASTVPGNARLVAQLVVAFAIVCCATTIAFGQLPLDYFNQVSYELNATVRAGSGTFPLRTDSINVADIRVERNDPVVLFREAEVSVGDADARAKASFQALARAATGKLQIRLDSSLNVKYSNAHPSGDATILTPLSVWARWYDIVIPHTPDLPDGELTIYHSSIKLDGFLFSNPVGTDHPIPSATFATGEVQLILESDGPVQSNLPTPPIGGLYFAESKESTVPGYPSSNEFVPKSISVDIIAPNNVPVNFSFLAELRARGTAISQSYFGPGEYTSHFGGELGSTITWGGITSVTTLSGEPIENWTITSASGFDYSKPFVPEPSSIALLSVAFCTWLGLARPRRRHW